MIDWLGHTILATSLLMALVLLVREPVRRQFGPSAAYGLWLIPALRLLMPTLTTTIERTVPAIAPTNMAKLLAASPADVSLIERLGGWEMLMLAAWLAGAFGMLLWGSYIYRLQRREVLRDSIQLARLGSIRIVRSAAVGGPMAFGILNRVIALPIDFDDRYDPNERRLALDHELAHHRSGDLVISHFAFLLLCLQWFNPLAWLSHRAFRFDQEAACDARVLSKASAEKRAAYAHAITKAASGPALLFAGALDRPRTLHRRLQFMLTSPSTGRRFAGKALILLTAAVAMPLTASRATQYVDVPAPAPAVPAAATPVGPVSAVAAVPAMAPTAPAASVSPTAALGPTPPTAPLPYPNVKGVNLGKDDVAFMGDDTILIDGARKSIDQLTPSQRSKLRKSIRDSQADLAKERAELPARLAEAQHELDRLRNGDFKRELIRDREDIQRDLAEIDSEAAELRAHGEDPAKRKAEIVAALHELDATDIDSRVREALEEANPARIAGELAEAEAQMSRLLAKLDQLDRR
jgi:beta-lactamase regulating signal transducer with metallopeptidase domain